MAARKPRDESGARLLRDAPHRFELDRDAQEMRLPRRVDVDARDDRRMLRIDLDQAFLFELHQRVAHRRLADAELALQFRAREQRVRLERQRENAVAQGLENLRRRLA